MIPPNKQLDKKSEQASMRYGFRCPVCGEELWAAKVDAKLGCQEGHALALVERAPEIDEDEADSDEE